MLSAAEIVALLGLEPHPEGGYFAEVFRSANAVTSSTHAGKRRASTAIYFLLRTDEFSAFHRVSSDEVWHHYQGDPLELHVLGPRGHSRIIVGSALEKGERPLAVVPSGHLQAARPLSGPHGYSLCGCTVAPGFEFRDFEMPVRARLIEEFPEHGPLISTFTR
ncbi:MAG TPA: cupin domain-containing protein [Polyangiaceae bacterium]